MARHDVDDAVHRIGAPQRRARPADDLDAVDVLEYVVDGVPEDAGEQGRVDRASVYHDEQLVRRVLVEAARRHRPRSGVEAGHVHAVGERERVGDGGDAGAADIVAGDDGDGRRRGAHRFGTSRGERDVDVHELFDRQLLEIL
jgi:hypothetical protein